MSKYTTEVRFICENYAGFRNSVEYPSIDEVLDKAIPKVFDFTFPLFDDSYRTVLERKILKHYYTREIGEETVSLWKFRMNTKLNEIMPYYNKLYNSELLEFNPLYTVNLTRDKNTDFDSTRIGQENIKDDTKSTLGKEYSWDKEKENDGTLSGITTNEVSSTSVSNSENDSIGSGTSVNSSDTQSSGTSGNTKYELYSDTPQGALNGVENGTYLTNAKKSTDNGSTAGTSHSVGNEGRNETAHNEGSENVNANGNENGTRNDVTHDEGTEHLSGADSTNGSVGYTRSKGDSDMVNSTEDYLEHVVGYEGATGSKMLKEFRETFLNIDMMIINELEPCFFQLW